METVTSLLTSELVNREDELQKIEDALDRLTTSRIPIQKSILEFNGIGGIGKTALLRKFRNECEKRKDLRYSFIDFHEFLGDQPINLNIIIVSMVRQINISNDLFDLIVGSVNDKSRIGDLTPELIEYLKRILQTPQEQIPLTLIFDSIDEVDQAVKNWLISIVDRTVDAGKILFALASKISLGFSERPNLEKKVYSFRLRELDKKYTLRHIQSFSHFDKTEDLENWAHAVFRVTHGHPLANEVVVSEAQKKKYHPQNINSKQYEFVQIINQRVVNEKVLHRYDDTEINRFRQMLTPLSIPRMFNLVSMGKLIANFAREYALESSWHYSNYIRELRAQTSFIRYAREKSAYVVDPILRTVFSLTLKYEDPKKFGAMHEFLVAMYTDLIENTRGTDKTKFFIEKIYHQLSLEKPAESPLSQFEEFAQLVGQGMSEDERRDARQQVIEEFNSDPDFSEFFDTSAKHRIQEMFE